LDGIATDFEINIKYRSELEFGLNSKAICEFDSIQSLTMMIRVQFDVLKHQRCYKQQQQQ
jgi:hypothetical protein